MSQYELNTQEEKIFEKQGFYVKEIISLRQYFINIILLFFGAFFLITCVFSIGIMPLMVIAGYFDINETDGGFAIFVDTAILILNSITFLILFIPDYFQFLRFHNVFFVTKQKFLGKNDRVKSKHQNIISLDYFRNWYLEWTEKHFKRNHIKNYFKKIILPILISLVMMLGISFAYDSILFTHSLRNTFYFYGCVSVFTIGTPLIRKIYDMINPRYVYATLGKKIQFLTPKIKEKSKVIQKNFHQDMNFSLLSDSFDSLASTFSEIVALVIKLEKIEARANKGNIFDSEKYIDSLRSDILDPLKSLKSFLETQKEELEKSQVELKKVRIRVGMADPSLRSGGQNRAGQEQTELASKRSEPLLQELTESIEKLDGMIQRIA